MTDPHGGSTPPSNWVTRWADHVAEGARVLDVACGGGRHARWFAARGHVVDAVDRDAQAIRTLSAVPGVSARVADIENGPWPYDGMRYGGVIVTNYLHRDLFPRLIEAVAPGGVLIYETFAVGNERFGRPSNPAFLLARGELFDRVRPAMTVLAYEDLEVADPRPAMVQRICARKPPAGE